MSMNVAARPAYWERNYVATFSTKFSASQRVFAVGEVVGWKTVRGSFDDAVKAARNLSTNAPDWAGQEHTAHIIMESRDGAFHIAPMGEAHYMDGSIDDVDTYSISEMPGVQANPKMPVRAIVDDERTVDLRRSDAPPTGPTPRC